MDQWMLTCTILENTYSCHLFLANAIILCALFKSYQGTYTLGFDVNQENH